MRALITVLTMLTVGVTLAGPLNLRNETAKGQRDVDVAISTNATASITYQVLLDSWKAAKNQSDKDAVIQKLLAKLAGVEGITADQKRKEKSKAGKP